MSGGIFVLMQAPDVCSEPLLAAPPPPATEHLQDANVHSAADISSILLSSGMFSAHCPGVEQVQVTSALSLANGSGNPFRSRRGSFLKVKAFLQSNPLNKPPA